MRITCVGGGPAGLYFAILMKEREPEHEITVLERDPAGTTYGWGVTLWADLLRKLDDTDPESARQISESAFRWQGQLVDVQGKQHGPPGRVRLQHQSPAHARHPRQARDRPWGPGSVRDRGRPRRSNSLKAT